jgi:beta-N-acetylglucosaminidase
MWVFYYPSDDRQKYFLFVDLTKKVNIEIPEYNKNIVESGVFKHP